MTHGRVAYTARIYWTTNDSCPRQDGGYGLRIHRITQNGVKFKIYELFISGIFHLIFSDSSWLHSTETRESKSVDKDGLLYIPLNTMKESSQTIDNRNS